MFDPNRFDPISYWNKRYRRGGHSGHVGKLRDRVIQEAKRRGDAISQFASENHIRSILDIGSGDGIQAQHLPDFDYLGLEVSEWAIKKAQVRNLTKRFHLLNDPTLIDPRDLHLSLDVIQHLPDPAYYTHLPLLFSASRFVVLAAPSKPPSPDDAPHIFHHEWAFDVPREWKALNRVEGLIFFARDPQ